MRSGNPFPLSILPPAASHARRISATFCGTSTALGHALAGHGSNGAVSSASRCSEMTSPKGNRTPERTPERTKQHAPKHTSVTKRGTERRVAAAPPDPDSASVRLLKGGHRPRVATTRNRARRRAGAKDPTPAEKRMPYLEEVPRARHDDARRVERHLRVDPGLVRLERAVVPGSHTLFTPAAHWVTPWLHGTGGKKQHERSTYDAAKIGTSPPRSARTNGVRSGA